MYPRRTTTHPMLEKQMHIGEPTDRHCNKEKEKTGRGGGATYSEAIPTPPSLPRPQEPVMSPVIVCEQDSTPKNILEEIGENFENLMIIPQKESNESCSQYSTPETGEKIENLTIIPQKESNESCSQYSTPERRFENPAPVVTPVFERIAQPKPNQTQTQATTNDG